MSKVNWSRVVLGGLVAGLVFNVVDYLMNMLFAGPWAEAMKALGKSAQMSPGVIAWFVVSDFLMGIFMLWLYASIRPRYGAGPKTAVIAGVAIWVLGLLISASFVAMDLFPLRLELISNGIGLILMPLGTVAGAAIYKEAATN